MSECNHEYELDFKSSIHICKHCGQMRRNQPKKKPVAWMYDFMDGDTLIRDWITTAEAEARRHMNVRPLYFGDAHGIGGEA